MSESPSLSPSPLPDPAQEETLLADYAQATGYSRFAGDALPTGAALLANIPLEFIRGHGLLPLVIPDDLRLHVLAAPPVDFGAVDSLAQFCERPLALQLLRRDRLSGFIDRITSDMANGDSALAQIIGEAGFDAGSDLGLDDDLDALKALAEDAPVVRLVQHLIVKGVESRGSDIHLEIFRDRFKVRYRIDGVLYDMESPPRRMYLPVVSHLKLRARMNIAERRLPQDGRIKMEIGGRSIDMRVSTIPTVYGESMVIRLLDQGPGLLDIAALGMEDHVLQTFRKAIHEPHGMILVTGPTGSGKTTTLYAALSRINNAQNKIITVEDPVEYQIEGVNQIQAKAQIDLTFANALRSIVRQDPDIIMIGEIRDRETAEIAIQSALTGHLVFSTLHTNDSFGAPHRLMEMGVESYLIASSVILIVAQRLVRMICSHCREPVEPTEAERIFLHEEGISLSSGQSLYRGRGCPQCANTGYSGRMGIYEMLPMSSGIKEAIIKKLPAEGVRRVALEEGVRTMRGDGLAKTLSGITTLEELARVTRQEM
ncbi:MAG: GspE/PulE family protein [Betaproteobacteria bacterium]|nr:GspE/PulE family protein [Betaproteobacteria bacterium]